MPDPTKQSVTFVIPTLNSGRYLEACLNSISSQDYPSELVNILIVDGGSIDETLTIAQRYSATVLNNPLRTGEAAKAIGVRATDADLVAFVDSDNCLVGGDWLSKMLVPLEDQTIVSSECIYWDLEHPNLSFVDRYCALLGVNDPLSFFLGNYGRHSYLSRRWTDLPVEINNNGEYSTVRLLPDSPIPTMGANGYIVRRDPLISILEGDYLFDIDIVIQLAKTGHTKVARVPTSIAHFFANSTRGFIRKTRRRASDYVYYSSRDLRAYPWQRLSKMRFAKFLLYTALIIPTMLQAVKGFTRHRDLAWFFHPVACLLTAYVYTHEAMKGMVGIKRSYDRTTWSH